MNNVIKHLRSEGFGSLILWVLFISLIISNQFNSIVLLLFMGYYLFWSIRNKQIIALLKNQIVILFMTLFLVYLISGLVSEDRVRALKVLERNISLVFLPLAVGSFWIKEKKINIKKVLRIYIYVLLAASVLTICIAVFKNIQFNIDQNFPWYKPKSWYLTYHYLAGNVNISAIYFSLFIGFATSLVALDLFGIQSLNIPFSKRYVAIILIYFLAYLLLLSARSTLITTILIIEGLFLMYCFKGKKAFSFLGVNAVLLVITSGIVYTNDVLRLRFLSIFKPYQEVKYFSGGLSSRFHQWNAIWNELLENNPIAGIGIGDIYEHYDKAYRNYELTLTMDSTFNAHNMYIEILFSTGLVGLIVLLIILAASLKKAIGTRNLAYFSLMVLIVFSGMTESILSRQYGIVFVIFFCSLFYFKETHFRK